jgi:hypothetical protein
VIKIYVLISRSYLGNYKPDVRSKVRSSAQFKVCGVAINIFCTAVLVSVKNGQCTPAYLLPDFTMSLLDLSGFDSCMNFGFSIQPRFTEVIK